MITHKTFRKYNLTSEKQHQENQNIKKMGNGEEKE